MKKIQKMFNEAKKLHQIGKFYEAKELYEKILKLNPNHSDALHLLGLIFNSLNQKDKAVKFITKAISIVKYEVYYFNLGTVLQEQNKLDEAIVMYEKVISINPSYVQAYYNLGTILQEQNRINETIYMFEKAISINPNYDKAYNNLGVVLQEQNRINETIYMFEKAISINPNYDKAYNNLGNILRAQNRFEEAIVMHEKAISINPNYAEAYYNLGLLLQDTNKIDKAISMYEKAIFINPNYAEAYNNLGIVLQEQNKLDEAIVMYEKVIFINPNHFEAYYNLGLLLQEQNKIDEAIVMYEKAISINPNYNNAYNNLGLLLQDTNKIDEAISMYEKAISINSNYAEAYWNKSLTYLTQGNLKEGFELYEYRWQKKDFTKAKRNFTQPLWIGNESLDGKTILIHTEQGLGDTLQFSRYIPMVVKLNAKVIFEVDKPLLPLLKQIVGVVEFIVKGQKLPSFDYYCPLLSLPHAFKTTFVSIPPILSNINISDEKIDYWKNKFKDITKPKIGLAWSGNPEHKNDQNRSIALEKLINFLPKEFDYISLQKEIKDEDKSALENSNISFFGDELKDFEDTAALIQNVDLVVSVDTSVAHLAGILGKKTFVLLPFSPDWRWMLNREDSPWYSSMKLFRQKEIANWDSVFIQVKEELSAVKKSN